MEARHSNRWSGKWAAAALVATLVGSAVLSLYWYWFGVADRYVIFLYGHLGATPFDAVTGSRYWMAGLLAAGIVLVGYAGVNGCLGRLAALRRRRYHPPAWRQVWLLAAPPIGIGIVAITMTANAPTLPPADALRSVLAALAGLALALPFGEWAAGRPMELAWALADGLGLVPTLGLLYAPERAGLGGLTTAATAWLVAVAALLASAAWLGLLSVLRWWRGAAGLRWGELMWLGFTWTYLLGPLAHHVLATPVGCRYITAAANFFANSVAVQAVVWLVAAALAAWAVWLRRALPGRQSRQRAAVGLVAGGK